MLYDALHKKKMYLDSFGEGLEEFGVLSLIKAFPEKFESSFTVPESIQPSDVVAVLKRPRDLHDPDVFKYMRVSAQVCCKQL